MGSQVQGSKGFYLVRICASPTSMFEQLNKATEFLANGMVCCSLIASGLDILITFSRDNSNQRATVSPKAPEVS